MLSTGEIIRVLMDEQGIQIKDLVTKTGIKEAAILNVIYNRSSKAEYLNRIASALDVPIETLLRTKKTYNYNTSLLSEASKIVFDELSLLNIKHVSSGSIYEYINSTYDNLKKTSDSSMTKLYVKGMMEGHLKFGMLKPNK